MLHGTGWLLAGTNESFKDRQDGRTVEYVALTVKIGDTVLDCTGKAGVLAGLNGGIKALEAGEPVKVNVEVNLRPDGNSRRLYKPQVTALSEVTSGKA